MLGTLDLSQNDVTIIGGGIAGLLIAYRLDQLGFEVTLYEEQSRVGGLIRTEKTPLGIAESAAHSFLATEPVLKLCADLDICLANVSPDSKARYILRNGKLRRFPLGFFESIRAFFRACFTVALDEEVTKEYTVAEWARRYLGDSVLRYLFQPFVRGIYGANPEEISINAAFPSLSIPKGFSLLSYQWFKRFKEKKSSLDQKKTRSKMMSPRDGMETLIQSLESHLRKKLGDRLKTNYRIEKLPQARNLILSVPAGPAARLLGDLDPVLAKELSQVRYTPLICITVFLKREDLNRIPRGVGVLMPEGENSQCLGILFNSSSFPGRVVDPQKWVSCTVMMGGTSNPQLLDYSDDQLREIARNELQLRLGFRSNLVEYVIKKWRNAVPIYNGQLMNVWEEAQKGWCSRPGRVLFGNYTGQVSLRGMIETVSKIQR